MIAAAPAEGAHAGDKFGERERFTEVIVAAGVQAFDALGDFRARGQQQHRSGDTPLTQLAQHAQAIAAGEHNVEDDNVEGAEFDRGRNGFAIMKHVHGETFGLERFAYERGSLLFVFDNQNAHRV